MTTPMHATDYLKLVACVTSGLIESAQAAICALDADDEQVEAILSQLDAVRHCAIEAAAAFCRDGHDIEHYADGREVRTELELELGNAYEHIWHPQPDHRTNRPQALFPLTTTSGARKRLLISAPGVVEAVDALRAVK